MAAREVVVGGHHELENRCRQRFGDSHQGVALVIGAAAVLGDDERAVGAGENLGGLVDLFCGGDDGGGGHPGRDLAVARADQQVEGDLQHGRAPRNRLGDKTCAPQLVNQFGRRARAFGPFDDGFRVARRADQVDQQRGPLGAGVGAGILTVGEGVRRQHGHRGAFLQCGVQAHRTVLNSQ